MTTNLIHPTAEQTVLSAMLNQTPIGYSIAANGLHPNDFSAPQYVLLFAVLKERLAADLPVDPDTVAAEVTNLASKRKAKVRVTPAFVANLATQDWKRAAAYSDTVKQMAMLRRAEKFANWFQSRIGEMPEPAELYAEAVEAMKALQPEIGDERFIEGGETPRLHADMLNARRSQPKDMLSLDWPWVSWNRFVRPLRSGHVALLAAPSGVGKSTFLEKIAEHWAKARHVVFVHLENPLDFTLDRRLARHARVTLDEIEAGLVPQDAYDAAMQGIMAFFPRLHFLHAAGWTMERILSELAQLQALGQCDAVVLDYLNKCRPSRTQKEFYGTDQWARQADDMEMLKSFCETHGIAALVAAQMNKTGNQDFGRKSRGDVRGSQEVIDKVQLLVLVSREIVAEDIVNARGEVIVHAGEMAPETLVQVAKSNTGRLGEIPMLYAGKYFDVRDIAKGL